jgi:phosphoheptose isomerase
MSKKLLVLIVILALVASFGFSTLAKAGEIIKAKVEAVNKEAKKIVLDGKEYAMTDEVAQANVDVGDEVEATVDNEVVTEIKK